MRPDNTIQPKPQPQPELAPDLQLGQQPESWLQPQPQSHTLQLLADLVNDRSGKVHILSSDLKGIRKELRPFGSQKVSGVRDVDYTRERKYVEALVTLAAPMPDARIRLRMLSLAAKNRAELISENSDFYPASIPLILSVFSMFLLVSADDPIVKWGLGALSPVVAAIFINLRMGTRRQVVDLKIIANILDAVEKQLPEH